MPRRELHRRGRSPLLEVTGQGKLLLGFHCRKVRCREIEVKVYQVPQTSGLLLAEKRTSVKAAFGLKPVPQQ